jgi:hypothetical protein
MSETQKCKKVNCAWLFSLCRPIRAVNICNDCCLVQPRGPSGICCREWRALSGTCFDLCRQPSPDLLITSTKETALTAKKVVTVDVCSLHTACRPPDDRCHPSSPDTMVSRDRGDHVRHGSCMDPSCFRRMAATPTRAIDARRSMTIQALHNSSRM